MNLLQFHLSVAVWQCPATGTRRNGSVTKACAGGLARGRRWLGVARPEVPAVDFRLLFLSVLTLLHLRPPAEQILPSGTRLWVEIGKEGADGRRKEPRFFFSALHLIWS